MEKLQKPPIIFIHVHTVPEKLMALCQQAKEHFLSKTPLLFCVPDQIAATYIDALLWRMPQESFIPHAIATAPTNAPICITYCPFNQNAATTLFNLCPLPNPISSQFHTIFELLDETEEEKHAASLQRLQTYLQAGFDVKTILFKIN